MDTQSIPTHTPNTAIISLDPFEAFKAIEGCPYEEYTCWDVASYLFSKRYNSDITMLLSDQMSLFAANEVWFKEQEERPETLIMPWDICFFAINRQALDHAGVVLSGTYFATSHERAGVVKDRFDRWRAYLLQVVRVSLRVPHAN